MMENSVNTTGKAVSGSADELCEIALLHYKAGDLNKAIEIYQQALALEPDNAEIYSMMGLIALQGGEDQLAEEFFKTAITFQPDAPHYHRNLGSSYYMQGKKQQAEKCFRKAIELDPNDSEAYLNLGLIKKYDERYQEALVYFEKAIMTKKAEAIPLAEYADTLIKLQRYGEAEGAARAAANIEPNNVTALSSLGIVLRFLSQPAESIYWCSKAVDLDPVNPEHHINLAKAFIDSGRSEEAEKSARTAVKLSPDNAEALGVLATAVHRRQRWDEALELLDRAIALDPSNSHLITNKATLLHLTGKSKEAFELVKPLVAGKTTVNSDSVTIYIELARKFGHEKQATALVEDILGKKAIPPAVQLSLSFTAGKFFDGTKQFDKAFKYYEQGNRLKDRVYSRERNEKLLEASMQVFDEAFFERNQKATHGSNKPIFIVGMPRSGTSLTEKIIVSHPEVFGAGELSEIKQIIKEIPGRIGSKQKFPHWLKDLNIDITNQAAQRYLDYIESIAPDDIPRVTDKMPQNFHYLGMISIMFPDSPIIHCNRDPLDTCLSNYFQNFAASGLEFAYDLENLGHYYRLYERLMAHWRKVLPSPIYELQYEQLVENPEEEVRSLIDFCGLEWNDDCLQHHKSKHVTMTASFDQTNQPIYKKSKQRWRNYESHLQPLIEALEKYK